MKNFLNSVSEIENFCSSNSLVNIRQIIELQSKLDLEGRREIRRNSSLASKIFKVPFDEAMLQDYYYWDNTTLSLLLPLHYYVHNNFDILEIGPGPAATLSRYLSAAFENLHIVCAEVDSRFATSAQTSVQNYCADIEVYHSDMTRNIAGKFDVVFMNPPYVNQSDLSKMGITVGTSEFQAGYGGNQGSDVTEKFLFGISEVLKVNGLALIGINNLYFPDQAVLRLIDKSNLKLLRKFYNVDDVPPFSQVYVLAIRESE